VRAVSHLVAGERPRDLIAQRNGKGLDVEQFRNVSLLKVHDKRLEAVQGEPMSASKATPHSAAASSRPHTGVR
jgi:hypothetical protein